MSQDTTTNSRILQEYYTQHRTDLSRLELSVKTKWEMATKIIDESYVFPISACPWDDDYFSTKKFLNSQGEIIAGNNVCPEFIRRNRINWLLGRAENVIDQRSIDAWFGVGSVWGVMAAKILHGTYLSHFSQNEFDLFSQDQLINKMSLVGSVKNASKTVLLELLKNNTYDEKKQLNVNAPLNSMTPRHGNSKKRYYCRVNSRMIFCIKSVVDQANYLSERIYNNARHWDSDKDVWVNDLGHTMEIVDYCVELKKQAKHQHC